MWLKVNEVLGRENIINMDKVERITSDGVTGSIFWFGKDDADSMHIVESFEEVMLLIHFAKKANGVMDWEQLQVFMNLCKYEEHSARLKELTLRDLAQQIEQDLIHAGTVSDDISVYDYLTKYFIK